MPKLRNIRLILEYDGSFFSGFQRQPGRLTIQDALETALKKVLGKKTRIASASGRTDAGVHALYQVVNFKTDRPFPVERFPRALNAALPEPMVVWSADEVPPSFHARFEAKNKTYEYCIWNNRIRSPLQGSRMWHFPVKLNIAAMRRGAECLKGRHDFKSFCASQGSAKTSTRTIQRIELKKTSHAIRIRIQADGFLYHMVRNIVGTLVEVGRGKYPPQQVRKILLAKDRKMAGPTAPATGLCLLNVTY